MSIFIEGTAFPIGVINRNGWGVPFSEVDNAVATLKTSVVRICSRLDPHGCDYTGDPLSEIGHVVDAWKEGDDVKVKAEITDSVAAQKIEDGTWKNNWSIFIGYDEADTEGWLHGIAAESITIVDRPAWDTATWQVVAASEVQKKGIRIISNFWKSASTEGGIITDELEELKIRLAEVEKERDELKAKLQAISDGTGGEAGGEAGGNGGGEGVGAGELEKELGELKTAKASLEKQLEENKKQIASLQLEKAKMVPIAEIEKRIAAALEEHDKKIAAEIERGKAFASFVEARGRLGLETNPEDYKTLSASDLNKLAADLNGIKIPAGAYSVTYPASSSPKGVTVGRWDSEKKQWVI